VKRVTIHVGKLVLHGLPEGRRREIGAAVERELARLALAPEGALQSLPDGAFQGQQAPSAVAREVGDRLGRALGREIDGQGGRNRP
jgi:hypothetical protein